MNSKDSRIFYSVCYLGFALKPPAVTEDRSTDIDWNDDIYLKSFDQNENMQKYIDSTRKPEPNAAAEIDSYILAYKLAHEKYQSSQEEDNNSAWKDKRIKRSAPELIKFELADAKEPDEATKELLKRHREQRNLQQTDVATTPLPPTTTTSAARMSSKRRNGTRSAGDRQHKREVASDDSEVHESRPVKIVYPIGKHHHKPSGYGLQKLPIEVQKIVDMLMRDKSQQKEHTGNRYGYPLSSGKFLLLPAADKPQKYYENLYSKYYNSQNIDDSNVELKNSYRSASPHYSAAYIPLSADKFKEATSTKNLFEESHFGQQESLKTIPRFNYVIKEVSIPAPVAKRPVEQAIVYKPLTLLPESHIEVQVTPSPSYSQVKSEGEAVSYKHTSGPKTTYSVPEPISYKYVIGQNPFDDDNKSTSGQHDYTNYQPATSDGQGGNSDSLKLLQYDEGFGDFQRQIISEQNLFQQSTSDKLSQDGGSNFNALSSLIGREPSSQLQGLKYLLSKEAVRSETKRPQDNTAPILFHPEKSSKTQSSTKIIFDADGNAQQDYEGYFSGATSKPLYGFSHHTKDYTPITESPEEVTLSPAVKFNTEHVRVVHVTPPPTSYNNVELGKLSPNYEGTSEDKNELQYASGYAFGYRVRDFHTGNDFGHTQNQATDGTTRGAYHILLADGRIQTVRYRADDSGYHADVSYESSH